MPVVSPHHYRSQSHRRHQSQSLVLGCAHDDAAFCQNAVTDVERLHHLHQPDWDRTSLYRPHLTGASPSSSLGLCPTLFRHPSYPPRLWPCSCLCLCSERRSWRLVRRGNFLLQGRHPGAGCVSYEKGVDAKKIYLWY
jgi:hypothetical protein